MTDPSSTQALSLEQVASRCGVDTGFLEQLVELGIIEAGAGGGTRFSREVTLRVHRCVRLQRDLGVNLEGAAVIFELLEHIESLELQLSTLRRR